MHKLEIMRNKEGSKLAYMSPVNDRGEIVYSYRIAGPKAWGGCSPLADITITSASLVEYIKQYAPEIIQLLNKGDL